MLLVEEFRLSLVPPVRGSQPPGPPVQRSSVQRPTVQGAHGPPGIPEALLRMLGPSVRIQRMQGPVGHHRGQCRGTGQGGKDNQRISYM